MTSKSPTPKPRCIMKERLMRYWLDRGTPLVMLAEKSKIPVMNGWRDAPITTWREAKKLLAERPRANYGIITGTPSGIIVLDIDGPVGRRTLRKLEKKHGTLPPTVTVLTQRGEHRYFRCSSKRIGNTAGKLGPNLDTRGNGGYVVGPGCVSPKGSKYRYAGGLSPRDVEIAEMPPWLVKLLTKTAKSPASGAAISIAVPDKYLRRARAYVGAALELELTRLGKAPQSHRNDTLNECAFKLGQLLPYSILSENDVQAQLSKTAKDIGLNDHEIGPTIRSGLRAGKRSPRRLPFLAKDSVPKGRKEKTDADAVTKRLSRRGQTEADNAWRLVERYGHKMLYTAGRGWLVFDGKRWQRDKLNEVSRLAEITAREIAKEVEHLSRYDDRTSRSEFAAFSLSRAAITNMVILAQPQLTVDDSKFDQDPWLFNVETGTIDLRTGELLKHDPRDLITKMASVAYKRNAKCPLFLAFLDKIFAEDQELMAFVQRMFGYALTGSTREQVFFFLMGKIGKNGKSTLVNLIRDLLGEYGTHTPTETLMVKAYDNGIPNDLARLVGKRMVTAAETNWNRQLDEAKIKAITGGEPITARFLRQEFFQFVPESKLFLVANDFPRVRSTSSSFWRRAVVVPFNVVIDESERDPDLPEKLKAEVPGILAWAVKGAREWQRIGLKPPKAVERSASGWRDSVDHVKRFFQEELIQDDKSTVGSSLMFSRYGAWCSENGETPLKLSQFNSRLRDDLNVTHKRTKRGSEWSGVKLRLK